MAWWTCCWNAALSVDVLCNFCNWSIQVSHLSNAACGKSTPTQLNRTAKHETETHVWSYSKLQRQKRAHYGWARVGMTLIIRDSDKGWLSAILVNSKSGNLQSAFGFVAYGLHEWENCTQFTACHTSVQVIGISFLWMNKLFYYFYLIDFTNSWSETASKLSL